ncbi:hypothetical protein [Psychromarinibacter sp. S121]|uniref:hypothetical protein n=1 Tax=Psychromarinibacter sp. S121 TaxID=3415127 RepID=UPI003C799E47
MFRTFAFATACLLGGAGLASAVTISDGAAVITERFDGTTLYFRFDKIPESARKFRLYVVGPNGYRAEVETGKRIPKIDLREFLDSKAEPLEKREYPNGDKLYDGYYSYEISFATDEFVRDPEVLDSGREKKSEGTWKVYKLEGRFLLDGGQIIVYAQDEEKPGEPGKGDDAPSRDEDEGYEGTITNPRPDFRRDFDKN